METEDNSTSYTMDETDELYRWAFFKFIEVKFFSSQTQICVNTWKCLEAKFFECFEIIKISFSGV